MSTLPDRYTRAPHERPRPIGRTHEKDMECARCGELAAFLYRGGLCGTCDRKRDDE